MEFLEVSHLLNVEESHKQHSIDPTIENEINSMRDMKYGIIWNKNNNSEKKMKQTIIINESFNGCHQLVTYLQKITYYYFDSV